MGKNRYKKNILNKGKTGTNILDSAVNVDEGMTSRIQYVNDLIKDWINNADNKVSVSLAVFAGAFGVIAFVADSIPKQSCNPVLNTCWDCVYRICFGLGLLLMFIALLFYAFAIIPNLKSSSKKRVSKEYPVFYEDIAKLDEKDFISLMEKGSDKAFRIELEREITLNSKICSRKMKMYRIGVILSIVSIAFALFCLAIKYTANI